MIIHISTDIKVCNVVNSLFLDIHAGWPKNPAIFDKNESLSWLSCHHKLRLVTFLFGFLWVLWPKFRPVSNYVTGWPMRTRFASLADQFSLMVTVKCFFWKIIVCSSSFWYQNRFRGTSSWVCLVSDPFPFYLNTEFGWKLSPNF